MPIVRYHVGESRRIGKPMSRPSLLLVLLVGFSLFACGSKNIEMTTEDRNETIKNVTKEVMTTNSLTSHDEIATFGAGCYWCIEAVLQQVDGVTKLESGFMGGHVNDPSYEAVCAGTTGHAEVVQIHFDPAKVQYRELLGWFWKLHDPTTLNRQGADVGSQYRSVIFYHNDEQKKIAEDSKMKIGKSGAFSDPVVTEISKAETFWKAKESHQDYYRRNKNKNPYCQMISRKLLKLGLDY